MAVEIVSLLIVIGILLYVLPSLIAHYRGHKHTLQIILLNLFLGWTIVCWFGAFVWSVLTDTPPIDLKQVLKKILITLLIVTLLFIGLVFGINRFLYTSITSESEDISWQLSTQVGYLISPYPFAQLHSDTAHGSQSSLYIHCRHDFLQVHIATNLHGQLPGDESDKQVRARHRIGQGDWIDLEWIAKRGGVTYPDTDFVHFVNSLDQEKSDLVIEFETGTKVQFPIWNGYDDMRNHITCLRQ